MLEKQTWIYLLINAIVTTTIMILMFKLYENKMKNIIKKINKTFSFLCFEDLK